MKRHLVVAAIACVAIGCESTPAPTPPPIAPAPSSAPPGTPTDAPAPSAVAPIAEEEPVKAQGAWRGCELSPDEAAETLLSLLKLFATPGFGVKEATRYFGGQVEGTRNVDSNGYANIDVRQDGVKVVLETWRRELIGVQFSCRGVELAVDLESIMAQLGPGKRGMAPFDSFMPGSHKYILPRDDFSLLLLIQPRRRAPARETPLDSFIVRRFHADEDLPEVWDSEDALVELIELALAERQLGPVSLYGALGIFEGRAGDTITLSKVKRRNMAGSRITVTTTTEGWLEPREIETRFIRPIPAQRESLAKKLGVAVGPHGGPLSLPRGTVELLDVGPGGAGGLRIVRAPWPSP